MKPEDLYIRSIGENDEFNELIRSLGGDPMTISQAAGMKMLPSKGPISFVSFAACCRIYENVATQLNEPNFGLKWTLNQPQDFRHSGPSIFLMTMAKNARQWIDMAIAYQKIHTNGFSFQMEEDLAANSVTGVINVHPLAPPCCQFLEHSMSSIVLLARQFIPDVKINLVTFQHSAPKDMALYEKVFQCPVIFNAERNIITADHHYLELQKTNAFTKTLTPFVKKYMDWQLAKLPKYMQSMSMVVTETIPVILGVKGSDIIHVAQALNIHPKKLQRLLKDEGTSYSHILDNVRENIAARLLTESDISIGRLAKMLDYSSDRPLTVATKRWFGASPTKYRQILKTQLSAIVA